MVVTEKIVMFQEVPLDLWYDALAFRTLTDEVFTGTARGMARERGFTLRDDKPSVQHEFMRVVHSPIGDAPLACAEEDADAVFIRLVWQAYREE